MSKKPLTATTFRAILSVSIFLIIGAGVALFIVANNQLRTLATDVSKISIDADASGNNLQTLKRLEAELNQQKETIQRTNSIVAESQSYQYQNQIISDLNNYANRAGISITNLDFSATQAAGGTAATPSQQPAAPTTPGASTTTPAPSSSMKSTSVSVTIANPVNYQSLLNFVRLIEQNLTKMQISSVGLSSGENGGVSSDALTIEVYIR